MREKRETKSQEEWTEVRRKKSVKDNKSDQSIVSFYVAGLPRNADRSEIGKRFSKHGTVVDVYLAGRKDNNGRFFAFVRFKGLENEKDMETSLNGMEYQGSVLTVNVAKFGRRTDKSGK